MSLLTFYTKNVLYSYLFENLEELKVFSIGEMTL